MNLFFLIFFGLLSVVCLFSIACPNKVVEMTAKYFMWSMKLYGFEGEIRPAEKAIMICRGWNIFMLIVLICFMFWFILETKAGF